jgi:hypothetical protein
MSARSLFTTSRPDGWGSMSGDLDDLGYAATDALSEATGTGVRTSKFRWQWWKGALTGAALLAVAACGAPAQPAHGASHSGAAGTGNSPPVVNVTVTCSPDGAVNACKNASQTSIPGGTALTILNAAEPETGSDTGSETFTLTIRPGSDFTILGLKAATNAGGGQIWILNANDLTDSSSFITKDSTTDTVTIRGALDFIGINAHGKIVYQTSGSAG